MVGQFEYSLMPLRSSADSRTLRPLYPTPTWSRICTTWPEKPHCGNCGVPFMNKTTSFDFTSFSMNFSMLIFASFERGPEGGSNLAGHHWRFQRYTCTYMYSKPLDIQSKMPSELAGMQTASPNRR